MRSRFLLSCALSVLPAILTARADPPKVPAPAAWDLPEADARKALARAGGAQAHPKARALVVFDRRDVQVEDSGLSHTVQHTLTQALDAAGARELATILLNYDPLSADVEVLRCRVLKADGVREVAPGATLDCPDPEYLIYWNSRHKLVPVGRLDPGDAVELVTRRVGYTYALLDDGAGHDQARFVPPMQGHFYDIVPFWSEWPIAEQRYTVTLSKDKHLQYQFFNGGVEVSDRVSGDLRTLAFTLRNFQPLEHEPNMVALSDVAPKLLLTTAPGWKAKAVWFHDVQEQAESFRTTPRLKAVADQVTSGLTTDEAKASALTHWVAENVRYIGLHMGKGEGYTLHPAEMTLRDMGGVCKDKAGILVALLRAAGLEAYAGMTMAGERIENLAADQFNHCITVWRRGDGRIQLLDPTWVPGDRELWSSREQQQEVLMGLPEGAEIMTTAISEPAAHPLRVTLKDALQADGTLKGRLLLEADGVSDAGLRRLYRGRLRGEWDLSDRSLLAVADPRVQFTLVSRSDPDDLSAPFRLEADFTIPGYARRLEDGSLVLVPLGARHPVGQATRADELMLSTKAKERAYPVRIGCSRLLRLEERMSLPRGATIRTLPDDVKLGGAAQFESSWRRTGDELVLDETLALDERIFPPEAWASLRGALEAFRKQAATPIQVDLPKGKK